MVMARALVREMGRPFLGSLLENSWPAFSDLIDTHAVR